MALWRAWGRVLSGLRAPQSRYSQTMLSYWTAHTEYLGHERVYDGDRLTVLAVVEEERIPEHVVAYGTVSADRFGWKSHDGTAGITFYIYENIRWCRGWVNEEGKQALLAAFALADQA